MFLRLEGVSNELVVDRFTSFGDQEKHYLVSKKRLWNGLLDLASISSLFVEGRTLRIIETEYRLEYEGTQGEEKINAEEYECLETRRRKGRRVNSFCSFHVATPYLMWYVALQGRRWWEIPLTTANPFICQNPALPWARQGIG